jgi:hypothetical protein
MTAGRDVCVSCGCWSSLLVDLHCETIAKNQNISLPLVCSMSRPEDYKFICSASVVIQRLDCLNGLSESLNMATV